MQDSSFKIISANKDKALALLKKFVEDKERMYWVIPSMVMHADNLTDAIEECRWIVEEDNDGNIVSIEFTGDKLGEDEQIFNAIAPAVENDSYIKMEGENGEIWKWVFNNGKCKEEY